MARGRRTPSAPKRAITTWCAIGSGQELPKRALHRPKGCTLSVHNTPGLDFADQGAARPMPVTKMNALWAAVSGGWRRLLRLAAGTHALALADQAVVSGASFLTMIMIGRWTGSRELGLYAIGMSVLSSAIAIQDSLIMLPYAIQKHRLEGTAQTRAGNALAHNFMLSALVLFVLAATAVTMKLADAGAPAVMLVWAVAAAAPFVLLREFGRRFAFAHLHVGKALALDAAVAFVQLGLLGWLQWTGAMSAVAAVTVIGAACGLSALLWLALSRSGFSISLGRARTALTESWGLGKWLFASVLTVQVQWYATYWLSLAILGAAAAGVYAACMSVVSFANPLIIGIGNILTPRAVLAKNNTGVLGLRRQAQFDALFIAAAMGTFSIIVFFAGEWIMEMLYPRQEYRGYGGTTAVLSLALLAQAVGIPASSALASMERPKSIFLVGSIGAGVTVCLVWILMLTYSIHGAAIGFLLGNMVGAGGRWAAFLAMVRRTPPPPDTSDPLRVVEEFTGRAAPQDCVVTRLGEGDHAAVVSVRRSDARPLWREQDCLVLKLFKPEAGLNAEAMRQQYDSVAALYAKLNGQRVDGWKISAPEPLHLCAAPPALIMTMARGKDLNGLTAQGAHLQPEALRRAARAVVGAWRKSWQAGHCHGDLALQNILCDFDSGDISFIDGGTKEHCRTCHNNTKGWPAAVLDLAHMLSDVTADVKRTLTNRAAGARRNIFLESALLVYVEAFPSVEAKLERLREVEDCGVVHLEELLQHSLSPRGLWRAIVRHVALRRTDAMFRKLRAEISAATALPDAMDAPMKQTVRL